MSTAGTKRTHSSTSSPETKRVKTSPPASSAKLDAKPLIKYIITSPPESTEPSHISYPSTHLTPFATLLSALILAKPLSHNLTIRTISTLLNPPYSLSTPKKLDEASADKKVQALFDARTQHKDKTAMQLDQLSGIVIGRFCSNPEDTKLEMLRKDANGDVGKLKGLLTNINGVGDSAAEIFLRRVQADWEEYFPFVDSRAEVVLKHIGVTVNEVMELIESCRRDEAEKRWSFVTVLDVLVLADLKGDTEMLINKAVKTYREDARDGEAKEDKGEKEVHPSKPAAKPTPKKRKASPTPSGEEEPEDDYESESFSESEKPKTRTRGRARVMAKAPVTKGPPPRRAAAAAGTAKRRKQEYSDDEDDFEEDDFDEYDDDDSESAYTESEASGSEYGA